MTRPTLRPSGTWRHPWPPKRYSDNEAMAFFDRENARIRAGKLTYDAWYQLSYKKRLATADPELTYWRTRLSNEARRGARRAHRYRRAFQKLTSEDRKSAEAFYREVKRAPWITCFYCSKSVEGWISHVDHKVPLCRGGKHERRNLAAACGDCNLRKNRRTDQEFFEVLRLEREAQTALSRTQDVHARLTPSEPVYACGEPHEVTL